MEGIDMVDAGLIHYDDRIKMRIWVKRVSV